MLLCDGEDDGDDDFLRRGSAFIPQPDWERTVENQALLKRKTEREDHCVRFYIFYICFQSRNL